MRKFFLLATLGLAACGIEGQPPLGTLAATTVSGTVTLLQPVANATVCVYSLKGGTRSDQAAGCTVTDESGNWSVRTGKLYGSAVAEASGGLLISPMKAMTADIAQFRHAQPIHITPISHLTAGFAETLFPRRQESLSADILFAAQMDFNTHFGAVPHELTHPWQPTSSLENNSPVEVTGSVLAHLFLAGFDQLARQASAQDGMTENTYYTIQTLVALLYQDVRADGIFDGRGSGGLTLSLGSLPLSKETLRKPLADAIGMYLRSPRNATGLVPADIAPMLKALSLSHAQCLGDPTPDTLFSDAGPSLSSCHIVDQNGARSPLDQPQSGLVKIVCSWADPVGVQAAAIDVVDKAAEGAFQAQNFKGTEAARWVDTAQLEELLGENATVALTLAATNVLGYTASRQSLLKVQNTRPTVTLQDQPTEWIKHSDGLSFKGTVDRPIRTVSLFLQDPEQGEPAQQSATVQRFSYESNTRDFRAVLTAPFACEGSPDAELVIEDWSGHSYRRTFRVQCDDMPPLLRLSKNAYANEFGGDDVYLWPWDTVLTFNKFFHKLDYLPEQGLDIAAQNLPALVFTVDNQTGPRLDAQGDALKVEYQHSVGSHTRAWASLTADEAGKYALPIAYQTLLPAGYNLAEDNYIARSTPDDIHELTIRVTDLLGNVSTQVFAFRLNLRGPPVKVTGCAPAGALLGGRLRESNLNFVYSPGFALFDANVAYALDLPEHSLAPRAPVSVALTSPSVISQVKNVKESWRHVASAHASKEIDWAGRSGMQEAMKKCRQVVMSAACRGERRIGWSDGLCMPLRTSSTYPYERDHAVRWQASQSVTLRSLDDVGTYEDSEAQSVARIRVNPDVPTRVRTNMATGRFDLNTTGAKELGTDDANAINWSSYAQLEDGTSGVVAHRLYGIELDGSLQVHYIDRRFVVLNVEMTLQPPQGNPERFAEHTPSLTEQEYQKYASMPLPLAIEMDQSCRQSVTLSWNRDTSEPSLH